MSPHLLQDAARQQRLVKLLCVFLDALLDSSPGILLFLAAELQAFCLEVQPPIPTFREAALLRPHPAVGASPENAPALVDAAVLQV